MRFSLVQLYLWEYASGRPPVVALKTRRSLRAVHFHPQGSPLLLSAEVTDAHTAHSSSASHSTAQSMQQGSSETATVQQQPQNAEQQRVHLRHAGTSHQHRLNAHAAQPFAAAGTRARQLLQQPLSNPNPASSTADDRHGSLQAPHSSPQGMHSADHPCLTTGSTHRAGPASHAVPNGSAALAADNQFREASYGSHSSPAQASTPCRARHRTEAANLAHVEPASAPASSSMHSMFSAAESAEAGLGRCQHHSRPDHCHNPFRDAAAAASLGQTPEQREQWQAQHLHGSMDSTNSGQVHAHRAAVDHQAAAEACRSSALHQDQVWHNT